MAARAGAVSKLLFRDFVGSLFWFPIWWYTTGIMRVVAGSFRTLVFRWREYGLQIWLRNFFVPMYGEYDITGRLVSVLVRFAVLIARLVAIVAEALFYVIISIAWIVAPVLFLVLALLNLGAFHV